ncbi:uncharacterized protein LOC108831175 isoform X1 [Raphanus sativus]|uniref:Uncharacterized protein LOC108831175 isoform X1 n=2 Tax=Raphanus sativus TaxID=3726 RepID=A0A6J0LJW0_RAPSA|nr:uncharacterized protein LOC108831175 isoform X1 [Raphanus sativus]
MAGLPLPLGSESQKIHERFCVIFEDCIDNNMSKAEILSYVRDKYLIPLYDTNRVWNHLERTNPDLFIAYNAKIRERKAQPLWNSSNVQRYAAAASPQEANAVHPSPAGPSRAANAIENQNVQTTLRQPVVPNDFCQQVLNALGQIQSTTEQMLKLLSDGHGFCPHPPATGSLKRKRVGENEERGENEKGEKLQENEKGGNESADHGERGR